MNMVSDSYKKIVLCISYDGTGFEGFQIQREAYTVQGVLEQLLADHYKCKVRLHPAGRTDSKVHAIRQYVHFDIDEKIHEQVKVPAEKLSFVLKPLLPPEISIEYSREMPLDFHTRYKALARSYCYKMYESDVPLAAFRNSASSVPQKTDWSRFFHYAQHFVGSHDFANFCARAHILRKEGRSTQRRINTVSLLRVHDEIHFFIEGNGFLWRMVRGIVGHILFCLKKDKQGIPLLPISKILTSDYIKESCKGSLAEAQGLYLYDVQYKEEYGLPYKKIPESNFF